MATKGNTTAYVVAGAVILVAVLGVGVAMASGPKPAPAPPNPGPPVPPPAPPNPPPPNPNPPNPNPAPPNPAPPNPAPPNPAPPVPEPQPGDVLKFDLTNNWGIIPMEMRVWLARGELAARIPGLARALAVKWWQAFRAKQPIVSVAEAAKIINENPELCRKCLNKGDAPDSKALLDKNIKQGWPVPKDYDGWVAGSYGLGDILGANGPHAGILTNKNDLPLLQVDNAAATMARYDVQLYIAAVMIRQFLFSENYSVLRPGANAANGDSFNTWGNIFSAWASPQAYIDNKGEDAKMRYLQRAEECGIDLKKNAYPWPPGQKYDVKNWTAQAVWKRLQEYSKLKMEDLDGEPAPAPEEPEPPPQNLGALELLGDGIAARVMHQGVNATDAAPLLMVFHGRDGDENQLKGYVPPQFKGHVAYLRGPLKTGQGFLWFQPKLTDPEPVLVPALRAAMFSVLRAIEQLQVKYPTTTTIAFGGSQGAAIVYALAALGAVDSVVALGGLLPPSARPTKPAATVVRAIHGQADTTVPFKEAEATFKAFQSAGFLFSKFTPIPGVHNISSAGKTDVAETIVELAESDTFVALEYGIALTPACQITITDLSDATWSLSRRMVNLAQAQAKLPLKKDATMAIFDAAIIEMAPFCALGGREFANDTAARDGYLAIRAALRALAFRGLTEDAAAASILSDFKQQAMNLGVAAGQLPGLDITA